MSASLAETLISAVSRHYDDPSKASVTFSEIGPGEFYGSICRYQKEYGEQKIVVVKATASTVQACVRILAERWLLSGVRHVELQEKINESIRRDPSARGS